MITDQHTSLSGCSQPAAPIKGTASLSSLSRQQLSDACVDLHQGLLYARACLTRASSAAMDPAVQEPLQKADWILGVLPFFLDQLEQITGVSGGERFSR
jgi:hypothetical protein